MATQKRKKAKKPAARKLTKKSIPAVTTLKKFFPPVPC